MEITKDKARIPTFVQARSGTNVGYSTWANPTGESIKALQAQLGHTDSRLTLSVYTQPMSEAQKKLAGKIARVLLPDAPRFENKDQEEGVVIH